MELTDVSPNHQKPFLMKTLSAQLQGSFLQSCCQGQVWHCLPYPVHISSSRRWRSSTIWRDLERIQAEVQKYFAMTNWRLDICSRTRRRRKEQVSKQFLCFRAIQGHSGDNIMNLWLQDNVLLPEAFTEFFYHVGNDIELHSIIRSGLIPGGKCFKSNRQSVFFTEVNPMDDDHREADGRRWTKGRAVQEYLETWSKHSVLVQFETRSRERIAILWNKITCTRSLRHIACDLYWGSSMHEYWRGIIHQSILISKSPSSCVTSEFANWTAGSNRSTSKYILRSPQRVRQYRETRRNIDHRISGYGSSSWKIKLRPKQ